MNKLVCMLLICGLMAPGLALASNEALQILSATPQGKLNALDDGKTITITFNHPVTALSGVEKDVREGPLNISPPLPGTYRWMGTSTLSFTLDELPAYSTRYIVTVNAPITAVGGEVMTEDYSFSFVTPRPQVEQTFPYQEQQQITLEQPLFFQFNQPVDPAAIAPFISLSDDSGAQMAVTVSYPDEEDIANRSPYFVKAGEQYIKVSPQQPMAMERRYTLRMKAGLPGKEGELGMEDPYELVFNTYNHFRVEGIEPGGLDWGCGDAYYPQFGIRLFLSNSVLREKLLEALHIEPAVEFSEDYSYEASEFTLTPNFKPNTEYTLTIDAGLQDIFGNTLDSPKTFTFRTTDFAPYLTMPAGRMISEAYLGTRFPIKIMNVYNAPFKMKAYRTPEEMLEAAQMMSEYDFSVQDPDVSREYRPNIITNKVAMMPFDLSEVLHEGEDTGIIGLNMEFSTCQGDIRDYSALIFLTNLSVTAKFSSENNLLWVTYLRDAAPVAGATVELYDTRQQFLWTGTTDAEGFVETPGWKKLGLKATNTWEQPWVFALVRTEDDQVIIHSRDGTGVWPYRFGISYQPESEHLTADGYLFTERGIYRPGEEVKIVGIIRDKQGAEFSIPEAMEVEVSITDPKDKELYKKTLTLSEFGSFHIPLQLKENAEIGTYRITCTFPNPDYLDLSKDELEWLDNSISGSFKVEMYRPVEFEVNVELGQEEYILGDQLTGKITANYLFGGAMRNVPLEWNLNRSPYTFSPQGDRFRGYTFERHKRDGYGHVTQKQGKLDETGTYALDYPLEKLVSGSHRYTLDARVTDVNKRMVSSRESVVVHGGEYYIGLKPESFFADVNEDFRIETLAVSPDKEIVPGQEYQVTVKRIWWESVRRAGHGGRLHWESEKQEAVVQQFEVSSGTEPVALSFPVEKVGYYRVEATGADARGNRIEASDYFYAIGSGYAAWLRSDDDAVELVSEQDTYQPGDVASIMVKSPYESVKALITVEREGVMDRWVQILEGSADTIEIPITSDYIPNIYVGVVLIQGRTAEGKIEGELDLGKPGFKIGYTGLKVNPAERQLQVEVTSDQPEYRPGSEVEVQLQVTNQDGVGQAAEVILSVVDLGVLNLIGYQTPNPFSYFYRERPLSVLTSELRNSIVGQRNYSEKGERKAGDGQDLAAMMRMIELREKFKPTAYHNPEIRTDAEGRATIRFTLPDNLSAFRIMATAHTKDSLFGAGDARITVNKKLMLTSSLPTFLRIGDTIEAGVLAHNRLDTEADAVIQTEVDGVMLASEDLQTVTLPQDDKQEVLFRYTAEEERDATFTFRGKMNAETDGLQVTLPVLLHRLPLTTALFGSTTEAQHQEFLAVPEDATSGWGHVKLTLASTLFTDIKGSADYLFGYPYGCLEQRLSRILPIILAEDLIRAFDLPVFEDQDYRKVVQQTLDQFSAFQHESGGFGYWRRPYAPSPFVSAYAVFAMAKAKEAGYAVDAEIEKQAVAYLENVLTGQNERETIYRYNDLAWNATDAFILYALALYDKYQPAYATRLFELRDRLPVFGKTLLLKAVQAGQGDEFIRDTLKKELMNSARIEARTAYFEESDDTGLRWIHHSNVRSTAAVAQALMEVYGADAANEAFIPKAIQWLLRERKAQVYWRTTQENLFVFWTLATYLRVFEGTSPDFRAEVRVNGQAVLSELFQGRSTKIAEEWVLLDQLVRGQNNPVEFVKEGEGRMYYTAVMTYLPEGEPEPIDAGLAVQKTMTVVKPASASGGDADEGVFERGDLIKVELTITTPRDRLFVYVDDPLPAGFKALNFGLKTTDQSLRQYIKGDTPFIYSEYKDDRVVFYADYVDKGVHTVSYLVSAEHSGTFNLPATSSAEMYTPEVFGQTSAATVRIR